MTASLIINAFDLARRKALIEGEFPLADLPRLASMLASRDGNLRYAIRGWIDAEGRPGATLELSARLPLICQRCTEPLRWDLERIANFRFMRSEEELDQIALDDDELDAVVGSEAMDAAAWIEDEALLSLPLVPRHDDCGPRLAGDGDAARPNPFAALAGLKRGGG